MLFRTQFCKRTWKMKWKLSQNIHSFPCVKRDYQLQDQVSRLMKTALCFPAKHFKVQWTDLFSNIFQAFGSSILHLLSNNFLAEHILTLHPKRQGTQVCSSSVGITDSFPTPYKVLYNWKLLGMGKEEQNPKQIKKQKTGSYLLWSSLFDEDT